MQGMAQLAERNRDLQLLQEGKISPAKKRPFTKQMREEAFERYLGLFCKEQLTLEVALCGRRGFWGGGEHMVGSGPESPAPPGG